MTLRIALDAAGGLALFVLAMGMMTDGLRAFAGAGLRRLLERWTSTPLRGVFAGILVTGLVHHSGAVTIAVIGFVNAGLLSLRQGLGVVFGSNVGTTMTGWLVSLAGFGFEMKSFALPILAVGVVIRLAARGARAQGLAAALAGFGLFFLGLGILRDTFATLAAAQELRIALGSHGTWPTYLAAGFVTTVLTQSSSASLAIVLTAAARGVIAIDAAAVAVIGANLGSTSTAAFAALRATPSARRLALGHIGFNVVTAMVALSILPALLWAVDQLADRLHVDGSPAAVLALFHTVFNVLGVVILLPFTGWIAAGLDRLFRSASEDIGRPQHLDATLVATPDLAVRALDEELTRLRSIVSEIAHGALAGNHPEVATLQSRVDAAQQLAAAVGRFATGVGTGSMTGTVSEELARAVRTGRYLDEAARLAPRAAALQAAAHRLGDSGIRSDVAKLLARAGECVSLAARATDASGGDLDRSDAYETFERSYQQTKAALLRAAVAGQMSIETTDELLVGASATRRLVEQLVKADRMLRSPAQAEAIEAINAHADGQSSP